MNLTQALEVCRQSGYAVISGPDLAFSFVLWTFITMMFGGLLGILYGDKQ